jgi:mannose-6-phosphate isomerase-like protein (cupin superfamily)
MRIPLIAAAAAVLAVPAHAPAQAPAAGVEVVTRARLDAGADSLARADELALPLGDRGAYTYLLIHRDAPGEVEVHRDWADVMFVRTGAATLQTGGTVSGARETGPGETRGGTASGGTERAIAAGDVVVVPAGIPHRVVVAPGGDVTYVVVKVATPATR